MSEHAQPYYAMYSSLSGAIVTRREDMVVTD